jgi:Domain of unknown function (DUF932)
MNLTKASTQWAKRPDDERFETLQQMREFCGDRCDKSREARVPLRSLRVATLDDGNLALVGMTDNPARFTHWSFGQFCQRVNAPAEFLRQLPPDLAQQALNHQLAKQQDREMRLLLYADGEMIVRAFNGAVYSRIWDYQIAEYLIELEAHGWKAPPARPIRQGQKGTRRATEEDMLRAGEFGLSVNVGDLIAPAGIYVSDHDCFAFMVDNERRISDGSDEGLGRGFFAENSEVGDGSFVITTFFYRNVCGNHIVWGAEGVEEVRIRHTGEAEAKAQQELAITVEKYAEGSVSDIEAQINRARTYEIAATEEEVVSTLFKLSLGIGKKVIKEAYDAAVRNESENKATPNTVWGIVNGLTEISQRRPHGDERTKVDRAAGKVMQIAF